MSISSRCDRLIWLRLSDVLALLALCPWACGEAECLSEGSGCCKCIADQKCSSQAGDVAYLVECLLDTCEAPGLILCPAQTHHGGSVSLQSRRSGAGGRRSEVQGHSQLYSYSEAILSYVRPPCLKKGEKTLGGLWRRGRVGRKERKTGSLSHWAGNR